MGPRSTSPAVRATTALVPATAPVEHCKGFLIAEPDPQDTGIDHVAIDLLYGRVRMLRRLLRLYPCALFGASRRKSLTIYRPLSLTIYRPLPYILVIFFLKNVWAAESTSSGHCATAPSCTRRRSAAEFHSRCDAYTGPLCQWLATRLATPSEALRQAAFRRSVVCCTNLDNTCVGAPGWSLADGRVYATVELPRAARGHAAVLHLTFLGT